MSFNVRKCKILSVTRAGKIEPSHTLNGSPLEHVGTFKDLGVIVDTKLSWRPHIDHIVKKANRVCGMVKRSVGYNAPSNVKLQLYKTLCRPNIEYSSQIWSPYHKDSIKTLESVQRSMSRYMLGTSDQSYPERCEILNILPLSYRREIMDLSHLFKYLHGDIDVDYTSAISLVNSDTTTNLRSSSHGPKLLRVHVNTETYKGFYFNRIVNMWNSLPSDITCCTSLRCFKAKLTVHYFNKLPYYPPNDTCTWTTVCRCQQCRGQN